MTEENRRRKLRNAEILRMKRAFPLSLFLSPDYNASAEIFVELGNMENDVDNKIKYYEEAARTYLMGDEEYNRYQASQMYERVGELCCENNSSKSIEAYKMSGIYSKQCGRESLAATSFQKAANISKMEGNLVDTLESLKMVSECYCGENWKHHRAKAMKDIASVYIELGKFRNAAEIFSGFRENVYMFCAFLCNTIEGIPSDFSVTGDESEVCDALEHGTERANECINKYVATHAISESVKKLLDIIRERLKPENDIL